MEQKIQIPPKNKLTSKTFCSKLLLSEFGMYVYGLTDWRDAVKFQLNQ